MSVRLEDAAVDDDATIASWCQPARAGLRILEIPVPYRCRTGGASKVAGSLSGSVKAAVSIVATFVRVSIRPPAAPTLAMRESP